MIFLLKKMTIALFFMSDSSNWRKPSTRQNFDYYLLSHARPCLKMIGAQPFSKWDANSKKRNQVETLISFWMEYAESNKSYDFNGTYLVIIITVSRKKIISLGVAFRCVLTKTLFEELENLKWNEKCFVLNVFKTLEHSWEFSIFSQVYYIRSP